MAVFEIQGLDGSTYEVEAPDENAAVVGFQRAMQPQQPAAAPPPASAEQPTLPGPSSALTAATLGSRQGLTFNFGDELMAAATVPIELGIGAWTGKDAGKGLVDRISDAYSRGLEQERALQGQAQSQNPIAYTAGNVAGGLATSSQLLKGGATLLNGGGTASSMIGRGAAEGALYGAAAGAGEGQGWEDRANKALISGGVGGVTGGALGGAGVALAGRNARAAAPSIDDLAAAKSASYAAADNAGVAYTPAAVDRLNQRVATALTDIGFDPALQPGATVALKRIQDLAGQNITLTGMDTLRKVASNGFIPGNKSNNMAVSKIIEAIDDVVTNPRAADVLSSNAADAAKALTEARGFAAREAKATKLADALYAAETRTGATGSGGNIDNASRQRIASILLNKNQSRGFTAQERKALETVAKGTTVQNLARLVGKLSPSGNGLNLLLQGGAAYGSGGATLPFAVAGAAAKKFADTATSRNVAIADALIRSGGNMPAAQLTAAQRALVEALTREIGPTQTIQK